MSRRCIGLLIAAFALLATLTASAQQVPEILISYPDMILVNGKVITMDDRQPRAEAVVIRDGKFLLVGTTADARKLAGPKTRTIDLQGQSVLPGFFDTHAHKMHQRLESKKPRMDGVPDTLNLRDKASAVEELRKIVEATKPGEWIAVRGQRGQVYYKLTRHDLDPVSPNNPVAIINQSQEAVVNSLALKLANIPAGTPGLETDPATGEPTGLLLTWAAGPITYQMVTWPDIEKEIPIQIAELKRYNAVGITSMASKVAGLAFTVYERIWQDGKLTMRLRLNHELLRQNANGEAFLKRLGLLQNFGDDWMRITGLAMHPVDGTTGDGAALTFAPQVRKRPADPFGPYGEIKWGKSASGKDEDETRTEAYNIILANRYGWTVSSIHSQGDKASNILLKTYLKASQERPIQGREFGLDHGLMHNEENIRLMKELGVVPSVAPKYLFHGTPDSLVYRYGADWVNRMTPVKTLIDAGIHPSLESDVTLPYAAPLLNLEALVTRKDESGRVWNDKERVDRMTALAMYTKWAARYTGDEDRLGTIETGKLADLVVLGGDFENVAADEIRKLPVLYTIVGGKIVFDRTVDKAEPLPDPTKRRRSDGSVEDPM